ncbi:MAG: hypothetical protein JKX97_03480 [Candidatus Lindowbacteria bacterium]|nr:hypothetical protein [Candidatus Lindowbacteria bacterium]
MLFIFLSVVFVRVQIKDLSFYFEHKTGESEDEEEGSADVNGKYHAGMLVAAIVVLAFLVEDLSVLMDDLIDRTGYPMALGALIVALIGVAPEMLTAVRAALSNRMQTVVNIGIGSTASSLVMTVPVMLVVAAVVSEPISFALDPIQTTLLVTSVLASVFTLGGGKTDVLDGAIHLALFFTYIFVLFI